MNDDERLKEIEENGRIHDWIMDTLRKEGERRRRIDARKAAAEALIAAHADEFQALFEAALTASDPYGIV